MFERYTERARRVIFFARFEASRYGSPYIETEHLLLGLLREDRGLVTRALGEVNVGEGIRAEIEGHITSRERISTSVEIPLTSESKKVLTLAAEEADRLGHRHVGTEHILLGLLRVEDSLAGAVLQGRGVRAATIREQLARVSRVESMNVQPKPNKRAMDTLDSFLAGLKWQKAEELLIFFAKNSRFVDVHGKRWNREKIGKEFEMLFAPYAKKNAAYTIEETLVDSSDLLVVIVLWKNAILASLERVWMHRMSVVLVPEGNEWAIMLAQVTPVQNPHP
jgi:Clp amino terminal domain, pathogenicity island component